MRIILSLGKALMHSESCPYLLRLCLPISPASVSGIRQLIFQISIIDATLMGYWISGQVSTVIRSVMCEIHFRMRENILKRVLMMPCAVFLRSHLMGARIIALLGSGRGTVDGRGDSL